MKNKKLLYLIFLAQFLFIPLVSADFIPPEMPDTYVLDGAEILSEQTESTLETQLGTLDQETSTQIVVVTLTDLQGYTIEEAGLSIGRTWGVGQEEFNNGLIFLIAPNEQKARIEVGYGLEGAITDAQSYTIVQNSITYFKTGDYDTGTLEGINYLEGLARGEEFPLEELDPDEGMTWPILLYLIPLIWALLSLLSSSKAWWLGGVFGGIIGIIAVGGILGTGIGIIIGLILDFILSTLLYKKLKMPRGGFWFGGGGRGGRGGFSGGGGGFGGGGASGGW